MSTMTRAPAGHPLEVSPAISVENYMVYAGRADPTHRLEHPRELGLAVLAALALIYTFGYTATAWIVGHRILRARTGWVVAFCSAGASCGFWP